MDPAALYEEARAREGAQSGHYNRNVRVEADSGPVVVRMRSGSAEVMDLTLWPEADILAAIAPHVPSAPRLVHAGADPAFQIHEFVEGRRVDDLYPDGKPLPEPVLDDIENLFAHLLRVPPHALPPLPADWPPDGDTPAFAARLLDLVRTIRHRGEPAVTGLYDTLGVPADPCAILESRAATLTSRPFCLLHADIHRSNMILTAHNRVVFLDWELALCGDPVYDLADHLHKMSYTPPDRAAVTEAWHRAAPPECRARWLEDLAYYLAYEAVKSAVVDTVRWGHRIATAQDDQSRATLSQELATKLTAAHPHWPAETPSPPSPRVVQAAVDRWLS
ncbi:aminoglycoside phosphotransferase family protein [Streptomyces sp. CB03238]|uniref:aminoglycoside phosphotransferase family protein n=1 Tax=Streptomyces sp. CB03238 TaxID=1907777 RepID=UPI00117DF395|nr:aminoglycoside phosphotransferase family protein [Streptomyces sp. CB03238]